MMFMRLYQQMSFIQQGQRAVSRRAHNFLERHAVSRVASKFHEALKQKAMVESDQVGYQNLGYGRVKGLAQVAHLDGTWVLRCPTASKGLSALSKAANYRYAGMRLHGHPGRRHPTGYTSEVLALCFTHGSAGVRCYSITRSEGPMFSILL